METKSRFRSITPFLIRYSIPLRNSASGRLPWLQEYAIFFTESGIWLLFISPITSVVGRILFSINHRIPLIKSESEIFPCAHHNALCLIQCGTMLVSLTASTFSSGVNKIKTRKLVMIMGLMIDFTKILTTI